MFTDKDLKQFSEKGVSEEKINIQIENFKKGFPFVNIIKAATVNDGIIKIKNEDIDSFVKKYEKILKKEKTVKFVPASGAASRMFKQLFEFKDSKNQLLKEEDFSSVFNFFKEIESFAFFPDLKSVCRNDINFKTDYKEILENLLEPIGLNYGNLPKGLLKFHKYKNTSRTPAEEHLVEGAEYSNSGGKVNIHFTVSPEHQVGFENHINEIRHIYEGKYNVVFNIEFSAQKPETDTIAVDLENVPFRELNGDILFRPGGHGALIENLNDIEADIIFVKNIDNVVPEKLKRDTVIYKKALAGILINKRNQVFDYIKRLLKNPEISLINEVKSFLETELFITLDNKFSFKNNLEKVNYLISKLNRPIRVCGMVRNEGEPGGGPFFVKKDSGSVSLQIVEGAQIDMNNKSKVKIVENATHFNPVDLILAVKDYKGNSFDLTRYIDAETGFISQKSKDGKNIKAQELPGLWNGAMAKWNTVFAEVPVSTFNPVKTVNDLLRETHKA